MYVVKGTMQQHLAGFSPPLSASETRSHIAFSPLHMSPPPCAYASQATASSDPRSIGRGDHPRPVCYKSHRRHDGPWSSGWRHSCEPGKIRRPEYHLLFISRIANYQCRHDKPGFKSQAVHSWFSTQAGSIHRSSPSGTDMRWLPLTTSRPPFAEFISSTAASTVRCLMSFTCVYALASI